MTNSISLRSDNPVTDLAAWSLVDTLQLQKFDAGTASITSPLQAFNQLLKVNFRINFRRLLQEKVLPSTWQLTRPLLLTVEQDENELFVVSDDVFVMFGTGETEGEALQNYVATLTEYYELLEQKSDEPTQRLFKHLQTYLHPA